jgi:hypothetical protein
MRTHPYCRSYLGGDCSDTVTEGVCCAHRSLERLMEAEHIVALLEWCKSATPEAMTSALVKCQRDIDRLLYDKRAREWRDWYDMLGWPESGKP